MYSIKNIMSKILEKGQGRDTRSGFVYSTFNHNLKFNLADGFPAVTSKKLHIDKVIGELLWFLSGSTDLDDLREYSNMKEGSWTIWTNDAERWGGKLNKNCGKIYGHNWRNFGGSLNTLGTGVDQISDLISKLKYEPFGRYHRVTAWNPLDMKNNELALPACHTDFQCYVTEDRKLDLHWNQRSVDTMLGLPYNVASYAALTHILAKICNLEVGTLSAWLGDTHIYDNHHEPVNKYMINPVFNLPIFSVPSELTDLKDIYNLTAKDFKLEYYMNAGIVAAPLSVGV